MDDKLSELINRSVKRKRKVKGDLSTNWIGPIYHWRCPECCWSTGKVGRVCQEQVLQCFSRWRCRHMMERWWRWRPLASSSCRHQRWCCCWWKCWNKGALGEQLSVLECVSSVGEDALQDNLCSEINCLNSEAVAAARELISALVALVCVQWHSTYWRRQWLGHCLSSPTTTYWPLSFLLPEDTGHTQTNTTTSKHRQGKAQCGD